MGINTDLQLTKKSVLKELLQTDNPSKLLINHFNNASKDKDTLLRAIIKELTSEGYLSIKWADNMPYIVNVNYAKDMDFICEGCEEVSKNMKIDVTEKPIVFISHRSTDKKIADMLVDFFAGVGIDKKCVFCSSLPGNDIKHKISHEVKNAIKNSVINIAILSQEYYASAYCLNEAGILWYRDDVNVIPIALPEIDERNMIGFLNNEYKLRRLDNSYDISEIYDSVSANIPSDKPKMTLVMSETNKLIERYTDYLSKRSNLETKALLIDISEITTDDEKIVLYYILKNNVRKVNKKKIIEWLNENEVHDVNVENAFDLLASFDGGSYNGDSLELGINIFRKYSSEATKYIGLLEACIEKHTLFAADTFETLWSKNSDSILGLFFAYIIEEKMSTFGDRWLADMQEEHIKTWEEKNILDDTLSKNYGSCLEVLIHNKLVYASEWTSHGNPRQYTLYPSIKKVLFNNAEKYSKEIDVYKKMYAFDLPF